MEVNSIKFKGKIWEIFLIFFGGVRIVMISAELQLFKLMNPPNDRNKISKMLGMLNGEKGFSLIQLGS